MSQLSKFNRYVGRVLGPRPTLLLRQLRHGELAWQRFMADRLPRFGVGVGTKRDQVAAAHTLERGYDALRITRENLTWVREQLTAMDIEFVELPHWNPYRPRVVISEADAAAAVTGLERVLKADAGWRMTTKSRRTGGFRTPREIEAVRVDRWLVTPEGVPLTSQFERVIIEPWRLVDAGEARGDGGVHVPGTLHRKITKRDTFIEYFSPEEWRRANWSHPHLAEVTEPVDIVYTWVDGNDPAWQAKKNAHLDGVGEGELNETAASSSRFTNRNELMYSLRSIEAYAS